MSTSLKVVEEGSSGLNIAGSIIFNGDIPILGMELFDRPLYGTEIHSAIDRLDLNEGREVTGEILKGIIGGNIFTISDSLISETNMEAFSIEETLFTSSKMTIDFIKNQVSIDLIEPDQYTSSVDLTRVKRKTTYNPSRVDLSVKYVKGNVIFGKDLTFTMLTMDFISTLGDINIEYVDGVVRAIPDSNDVTECIISNCIVTYGSQ